MNYFKKYKNLYDQDIILLHKGELTFDLVTSLIASLEERIEKIEEQRQVVKKFYNVSTEIIQNLYYHIDEVKPDDENISSNDTRTALIMIWAHKRYFSFQTGNYIPKSKIQKLDAKLKDINSKDSKELRQLYKEVLANSMYSSKGTGGLGFIDIARKSGEKIDYEFIELNEDYSYFSVEIRLPR